MVSKILFYGVHPRGKNTLLKKKVQMKHHIKVNLCLIPNSINEDLPSKGTHK